MDKSLEKQRNGSILSQKAQLGEMYKRMLLIARAFLSPCKIRFVLPSGLSPQHLTLCIHSTVLLLKHINHRYSVFLDIIKISKFIKIGSLLNLRRF